MKKIDKIITENIQLFLLREGLPVWKEYGCPFGRREKVNISNWYLIGKIGYTPYGNQDDYLDIWSNPQDYHEYALLLHSSQGVGEVIGDTSELPSYAKSSIDIFEEFKDTDYSIPFLGKRTEEDKVKHEAFMSKLNIQDGKIVLKHYSNVIIQDGKISRGYPANGYSNNSDVGWYSWATEKIGNDPSNSGRYTYFCLVDINDFYDFQNDLEKFSNLRKAVANKPYVGVYWGDDTKVIAVSSFQPTPFSYVRDNSTGDFYDNNWDKI